MRTIGWLSIIFPPVTLSLTSTIILHQSLVNGPHKCQFLGPLILKCHRILWTQRDGAHAAQGWTHMRAHAQISACSVPSLCLNGVFIGSHLVRSKSSQESPCPIQVKLISVLCLILGLYKRKWETALLVGWYWYQDTSQVCLFCLKPKFSRAGT